MTNDIKIIRYTKQYQNELFKMLQSEGKDWQCYWKDENAQKYKKAIENSITYVALKGEKVCGYVRCRPDDGFGVYIYDLLVDRCYRGNNIGRMLMERVCGDYSGQPCYAMSDVDGYYIKQGYKREGSVFIVKPHKQQ